MKRPLTKAGIAMSKAIKILAIVLLSLLIVGLIATFVLLLNEKMEFPMVQTELVYDENISEPFDNIQVSIESLDIKLIKAEDSNVNVKVYDSKDNEVSVKVEDDTLIIENNKHTSWHFLSFGTREVVISLPEREYDLIVNSTSGDVKAKIAFNDVTIVTTSGDIKFTKVNDLEATVTSGDIEVDEVNNITIASNSGDVEIGKINKSLDIETTSGDIDIDNLTIVKDSSIKVTSGDVTIHNSSNNIYYNTKVTSGDVKINNNNRHAEYELKIDTKSGDIIVK